MWNHCSYSVYLPFLSHGAALTGAHTNASDTCVLRSELSEEHLWPDFDINLCPPFITLWWGTVHHHSPALGQHYAWGEHFSSGSVLGRMLLYWAFSAEVTWKQFTFLWLFQFVPSRMALWEHGLQNEWDGPGNLCLSLRFHFGCNCSWQVRWCKALKPIFSKKKQIYCLSSRDPQHFYNYQFILITPWWDGVYCAHFRDGQNEARLG